MEIPDAPKIKPDSELSEEDWERLLANSNSVGTERLGLVAASRSKGDFVKWAGIWSGAIGATLFLLGILFFFASNWKEMSPELRLGVLQGSVGLTAVAACILGIRHALGQWLLIASTVLVGVLLAVFGQTFQTGADSYEVFALWTFLTLVWVILAKSSGLWILWFAIAQAALSLYSGQVLVPDGVVDWSGSFILQSLFSLAGLAAWEWLSPGESFRWLQKGWIRLVLVTNAVIWLSFCPWRWIFDIFSSNDLEGWTLAGSLLWILAMGLGIYFYQKVRFTIGAMSSCLFSVGIITVSAIARVLIEIEDDSAAIYLLIGLISVVIFSLIATWIIRVSRSQNASVSPTSPTS